MKIIRRGPFTPFIFALCTLVAGIYFCTAKTARAQVQGNFKYRNAQTLDRGAPSAPPTYQQQEIPEAYGNVANDEIFQRQQNSYTPTNATLSAQTRAGSISYNDTVFSLVANVMENAIANEHVAIFSLTQVGLTVDSANTTMEESLNKFIAELSAIGVPRNQVLIDMISFEPKYESQIEKKVFSKRAIEVPKGFELKKNVHVRYGDDQQFNKIMAAATKAEIFDLIKVDYFVPNIDQIYERLRKEAVRIIENKRKTFAAVGVVFDSTYNRSAAESMGSYYPADRYFDYVSQSAISLDALKKKSGDTPLRADKNITQFYHKVPYNNFDMVLNPVILEPSVQFTYSLQVRYTLKRRVIDPKPRPLPPPKAEAPVYYKIDEGVKVVVPIKPTN